MQKLLNSAMQWHWWASADRISQAARGLGAILTVPTVVFSLYGMNFKWMPELEFHDGYPCAVGFTVVACLVLYKRLQKTGWI